MTWLAWSLLSAFFAAATAILAKQVTPAGKQIYLIADNHATHKHPKVEKWLARHRRFHVYFTPTSSSWLNMVERFFRDLTQNRLRRGIRDVEELIWFSPVWRNLVPAGACIPKAHRSRRSKD